MKKIFTIFIIFILTMTTVYAEDTEPIKTPVVSAQAAVLMDAETGRVLWGKNADKPMAMASTTKIMTAILAIEKGNLDDIVTASERAAAAPKVKMNLQKGEEHRLEDLLYPLMLQSSNDAAIAIAEHVGGSVEEFCKMMTEKAKELGACETIFETPNGLDSGDHHSTAKDMALITCYALKNPKFLEIINTRQITIPVKGGDYKSYTIVNKNRLLNEYNGAIGVKTGFTGKAGQCFVGAAKRDDKTLVSVVLASGWGTAGKEKKWSDTKKILDYGFNNYDYYTVVNKGDDAGTIPVMFSREGSVDVKCSNDLKLLLSREEREGITVKYILPNTLESPVTKGQAAGRAVVYTKEGKAIARCPLETVSNIARHDFKTSLKKVIKGWLNMDFDGIIIN